MEKDLRKPWLKTWERKRYMQVEEAHRVSNRMNPSRPTRRSVIILMAKVKDRITEAVRETKESITRELP